MTRALGVFKGTYLILRMYLLALIGVAAVTALINFIIRAASVSNDAEISLGNLITVFLVIMPVLIQVFMFKKLWVLGASRKDIHSGALLTYLFWTTAFALFNMLWLLAEDHLLEQYRTYLNIIKIFNWDMHGLLGIFVHQLGAYLLVVSFLHLLSSCFWHRLGIGLYVVLGAFLIIAMSISSLRGEVVEWLSVLLFNPNPLVGFVLSVAVALLLFAGGWWFTKRREVANV